jgi:hypothetical protein
MRLRTLCALAVMVAVLAPKRGRADCPPGVEFCWDGGTIPGGGGTYGCWSDKEKKDICNTPPEPCEPSTSKAFTFIDDQDGTKDGQLMALGDKDPKVQCGTLTVTKTAYYRIYDTELSESCSDQLDETGYLRVTNSCNPTGVAVEANSGDRYVILDSDNTPSCTKDSDCQPGRVCREGNMHGNCCVPSTPTFMGTFLLVAGEKNKICLYHWCPVWLEEKQKSGTDLGFVTNDCKGVNSVHFKIDANAIACEENETLKPCTWGCENGKCLPDPCLAKKCPAYCKDGVCLEENPCAGKACKHGCKNGYCLQPKSAPGPDNDGDGYPYTADCDDNDAGVNPGQPEICGNKKDDNCDGFVDESACTSATSGDPGGAGGDAKAGGNKASGDGDDGCRCGLGSSEPPVGLLPGLVLLVLLRLRRQRR